MTISITAQQRDALYEEIVVRLSGIDAVFLAVKQNDYQRAQRLGREFADDLQLLVDDLGWGESPHRHDVDLTTPPEVLRRALGRHYESASSRLALECGKAKEAEAEAVECQLVMSTCKEVLKALDGEQMQPT